MNTDNDDFFVEDEPVADVLARWEEGQKCVTRRPGVTVLIATHPERQTSGLINRAFASVAAQTLQPVTIIINNDLERKGAGANRQRLLDMVDTEWTAWIDSDDEWHDPQHLEKLMRVATETDSVYVFPGFLGHDPLGHFGLPFNPCSPYHTTMGILERTDITKEAGFCDSAAEGRFSNEDWFHMVRFSAICCERGLKMTHLAERTFTYHQHGQNTSGLPGRSGGDIIIH